MIKTTMAILRNLLLTATLLLLVVGCADDHLTATEEHAPLAGEIILTVTLSNDDRGKAARAGDETDRKDETSRPGVYWENEIHTAHLFIEGTSGMESYTLPLDKALTVENNQPTTIRLPLKTAEEVNDYFAILQGRKTIYLGFNLRDEQVKAFKENNKEYNVADDGYTAYGSPNAYNYGIVGAYAPENGIGLSKESERKHIAMFCMESITTTPTISEDRKVITISDPFLMKRNVAKVLTTCETVSSGETYTNYNYTIVDGEENVAYCKLSGSLVYPNKDDFTFDKTGSSLNLRNTNRGWIRQSDVKYMLNGINLKSYIMQKRDWKDGKYSYIDPNYNKLGEYITLGEGNAVTPTNYQDDFLYTPNSDMPDSYSYYAQTLPYVSYRMPQKDESNTGGNYYFEGLYCPENTFTFDELDATTINQLNGYQYPWPMMTHVSITALFTPRELYVEKEVKDYLESDAVTAEDLCVPQEEFAQLMDDIRDLLRDDNDRVVASTEFTEAIKRVLCPNEAVSKAILTASLRMNGMIQQEAIDGIYQPEADGFPPNTYFVISRQNGELLFYTYGAAAIVAEAKEGWTKESSAKQIGSFAAMPRGRGYYYTYIDNRPDEEKIGAFTLKDAQVERNVYYILTISSISKPGIPTGDQYIKVHTKTVDWKPGGKGTIELN